MPDDGTGSFATLQQIWFDGKIPSPRFLQIKGYRGWREAGPPGMGLLPEFGIQNLHPVSEDCYDPEVCSWPLISPEAMQTVPTQSSF